jgi:hypothetical protein
MTCLFCEKTTDNCCVWQIYYGLTGISEDFEMNEGFAVFCKNFRRKQKSTLRKSILRTEPSIHLTNSIDFVKDFKYETVDIPIDEVIESNGRYLVFTLN